MEIQYPPRNGRRLLIVESDPHVSAKLVRICQSVEVDAEATNDFVKALRQAAEGEWHSAFLSLSSGKQEALAVADILSRRSVPFIFVVNGPGEGVPPRYAHAPQLVKPLQRERVLHLATTWKGLAPPRMFRNPILDALLTEAGWLRDHLSSMALQVRQTIIRPNQPLANVVFVESGMCSVIGRLAGNETEIALIGCEGMIGGWLATEVESVPYRVNVQIEGMAAVLAADRLRQAMEVAPPVRNIVMRYQHHLNMQFAAAATANATLSIERRLARWLMTCSDRIGPEIPVVHEHLSWVLSVRRPGVTEALHRLQQAGLVEHRRGFVCVVDRDRLNEFWTGVGALSRRPALADHLSPM